MIDPSCANKKNPCPTLNKTALACTQKLDLPPLIPNIAGKQKIQLPPLVKGRVRVGENQDS
ncbi:hypothetical protein CBP28_19860 [Fischerella thermalis WC559]|nr:hypothetical protein CBP18_16245 [Fischerella thermalis WC119]PLZ18286.1 hypothetical protein CBP29_20090 [Fischerella thermalis WC341]PLZ21842.1 hypothetical protein CBP30_07630 [Fischerella thermalis WC157]PLZ22863.1 hypothetical protein CBP28_19860 [Fischerella thermalis WC559]PLZ38555.1 hypothetical protein CBP26_15190 [Fischerella thermalis WC538]PLZ43190.1 hypothetical protein CBP25_13250 [Fischerella thermalis WC527]PLZ49106.1 hypothetical protein CBP13_18550 [Fischerella thermalis 